MPKSSREFQCGFFRGQCRIKQDQDLIDLISANNFDHALGFGDTEYFKQFVNFVDNQATDFCIFIINRPFDFDRLCLDINDIVDRFVRNKGLIYLSLNKYLIQARCYDGTVPLDFDEAIEVFVKTRVRAEIVDYKPCGLDLGLKFNWVHPLTRFLLQVNK